MDPQPLSFWKKVQYFCHRLDLLTVLFSVILGSLIWFYVNSRRTAIREIRARVDVAVPEGWQVLDGDLPCWRTVVLRGPQQLMQGLRQDDMRFTEKLEPPKDGGSTSREIDLALKAENLTGFPRDVMEVVNIPDPKVTLHLVRPVRRYVPVTVELEGTLPEGYVMKDFRHSPQYLPVVALEDEFKGLEIKTRPVSLSGQSASFSTYADLQPLTVNGRTVNFSESVFIRFNVTPKPAVREIENVPVGLLLATPMEKLTGHKIIPSHVTVRVEGDANLLGTLSDRALSVYIDSRDLGTSAQAEYTLKCHALASEGLKVVGIVPGEVKWQMPQKEEKPAAEKK